MPYGPTSVAYDPVRQRYLVGVPEGRPADSSRSGRFVAADGTLLGDRFTVSPTSTYVSNGVAYNPISDTYFVVFPHHDIPEIYGTQVTGAGVVDPMMRVTTVLESSPAVLGVDYPRVATATDRAEWLASSNIWWSGAIGQRVRTNTVGTPGVFSKLSPGNGTSGVQNPVTLAWTPVDGRHVRSVRGRGEQQHVRHLLAGGRRCRPASCCRRWPTAPTTGRCATRRPPTPKRTTASGGASRRARSRSRRWRRRAERAAWSVPSP